MKYIKSIIVLLVLISIIFAQTGEESHLKCSHSKTEKSFITNYSPMTALQNNYDVTFYDINLDVKPDEEKIYGEVGIIGTSLISSLDVIELDLANVMTIESIKNEQGADLNFGHNSNLVSVTLPNSLGVGDQFNIIIKYNGQPQATGLGSFGFNIHNGSPMVWSLSEPYGARDWWPCKDTPLDKADSVDISVKVPPELIVASNGKLVNTENEGNSTIYHWQERYPIATYLVSVAIHPYTVFYDWYEYSPTDSMRLEYYVFPENFDRVQDNYALVKDMLTAMSVRFGEYPFIEEKYGHAEFVWGGGMEHQTLSSMGGHSEALIAHELAHQWWGDMVTCANFHHIWLNEGLANYSEALWYELRDNDIQSLHEDMAANRNWYNWQGGSIYVEDTTSTYRIFYGPITYAKATWVVHMLRHIVGDDNFFEGLKEYGERYRFSSAVTEQFQAVMEDISGMDLDYYFQRWIYGELFPIYDVVYEQSDDRLFVKLNQIQDSEFFEMPIDLQVSFTDGTEYETVLYNSIRNELFDINIGSGKSVDTIMIDPDDWILKQVYDIREENLDTLDNGNVLDDFILYPLYPNPFNSDVSIKFNLDEETPIKIEIFNIEGLKVWQYGSSYSSGIHTVRWGGVNNQGNKVPTGTYLVEVSNDILVKSRKILLLK